MDAASPPPADRVPTDDDHHVAYAEHGDPAGHPVRFRHGTTDANVPIAGVRTLRDRLPDARPTAVEDADHLTTLLRSREPVVAQYAD
jgi:pimeloyl-ACP methyl ester carboxylesterase